MLLAITIHFLVPVLFLTGVPTNELWSVNSIPQAILLLWGWWVIISFSVCGCWITILTLIVLFHPYFRVHFSITVYLRMFSSGICHYIIGTDQCYHLVHINLEIHLCGNLNWLWLSPSATSSSSPWFIPRILQHHLVDLCCILFLLRPAKSEVSWHQSDLKSRTDMMVGTFSKNCNIGLGYPVRWCHA